MYYIGLGFTLVSYMIAHYEVWAVEEPSAIKVMRLAILAVGGLGMMAISNRDEIDKLKQKIEYLERKLKDPRC